MESSCLHISLRGQTNIDYYTYFLNNCRNHLLFLTETRWSVCLSDV